ncbi:CbiX/SirB N-terminal domain-containing protein [Halovenus rubra]|uniref:CbiX/SirB N-terminal domain-containing protein n=2 Tax=Halovenus rubra TaxID=869890 RepID=A0ABD5X4D4_9EURY|nr:CbiX/SirB N-terminal domain-containing protein [Halovenus rubra]
MSETTLVLAGHGSHRNSDSSSPVWSAVNAVRDCLEIPVRGAFWKEEPSFRSVLRTIDTPKAVIVPFFISEGYFTERILPREAGLGAADRRALDAPVEVQYADPVGTHPAMRDVVLNRVRRSYGAPDGEVGLALLGHGTERNPNSARAVQKHAEALSGRECLSGVAVGFMDEEPPVSDVLDKLDCRDVVVVPLFVADGFHTRDEIPALLGLVEEEGADHPVPGRVDGKRVYYLSAVGTDPSMVDVILERAAEAGLDPDAPATNGDVPVRDEAGRAFIEWLDTAAPGATGDPERTVGELLVVGDDYELRHRSDRGTDTEDLDSLALDTLRERVRYADDGRYRPFPGERTLPRGWRLSASTPGELLKGLATVYPVAIEHWYGHAHGDLDADDWQSVADRQTGIYASVADLDPSEVERVAESVCGECSRCPTWTAAETESETAVPEDGELPCPVPCSFLVAAARECHQADEKSVGNQPVDADPTEVARGDLTDPANRYRVRYRETNRVPSAHGANQ